MRTAPSESIKSALFLAAVVVLGGLVAVLFAAISTLSDKVNNLESNIEKLSTELKEIDNSVGKLYSDLREVEGRVSDIEGSIRGVEASVINVRSDLDTLKEYVEKEIERINSAIAKDVRDKFRVYSESDVKRLVQEGYGISIFDEDVREILEDYYEDKDYYIEVIPFDDVYVAYDRAILEKILNKAYYYMKYDPYLADYYDCDDYALVTLGIVKDNLPGAACFLTFVVYEDEEGHMQVVCIDKDENVIEFEPQTGEYTLSGAGEISELYFLG